MQKRLAREGGTLFLPSYTWRTLSIISHCKGTDNLGNIQILPYLLTRFKFNMP